MKRNTDRPVGILGFDEFFKFVFLFSIQSLKLDKLED